MSFVITLVRDEHGLHLKQDEANMQLANIPHGLYHISGHVAEANHTEQGYSMISIASPFLHANAGFQVPVVPVEDRPVSYGDLISAAYAEEKARQQTLETASFEAAGIHAEVDA